MHQNQAHAPIAHISTLFPFLSHKNCNPAFEDAELHILFQGHYLQVPTGPFPRTMHGTFSKAPWVLFQE